MSSEERQAYIDEMQKNISERLVVIEELKRKIQRQKEALEKTKKILLGKLQPIKS